jgi:hypothetical protein
MQSDENLENTLPLTISFREVAIVELIDYFTRSLHNLHSAG